MATSAAIVAIVLAMGLAGFRVNLTPSFPLGLWRIGPLTRAAEVGDTVFICLPADSSALVIGRERGYLPRGLCPGGVASLIKTIVAVGGQRVTVAGDSLEVDGGAPLVHSAIRSRDGKGRPMTAYASGIVPPGFVFLHSDFVASYDSRYFGPVPASGILGLARPVLTFAP